MPKITSAEAIARYGQLPPRSRAGGVAAAIVSIIGAYILIWHQDQEAQLEALQASLRHTESERAEKSAYAANLSLYEARLTELGTRLQDARAMLPDTPDVPQFLSQIGAIARDTGLTIERFEPGAEKAIDFYAETQFLLQVRGTYHAIGMFLDQVSRMDRIVNVGDLSMTAPKVEAQQVMVTGSFFLRAFRSLSVTEAAQMARREDAGDVATHRGRP